MKHVNLMENGDGSRLKEKVENWLDTHKDEILEIIDIDYQQYGSMYLTTITYEEKR